MPLNQILIGIGAKLDMGSHRHKPLYTHYPVSVSGSYNFRTNYVSNGGHQPEGGLKR